MSTGTGGTRKPYPEGRKKEMTEKWKQDVREKLAFLGQTQTWLAAQVGVDKSAVTLMLKPEQVTSSMVEAVSDVLEIPLPQTGIDPLESETLDEYNALPEEDQVEVRRYMAHLRKLRDQAKKP